MTTRIGVYIHIPFCRHKCFYCDFHSVTGIEERIEEYVNAAICEIGRWSVKARGHNVRSIFFGGGTPSLLQPAQVKKIITAVTKNYEVESGAEITMEANPESLTLSKLRGYLKAGVNRVSIGVQSLNNDLLKKLDRIHTKEQALTAIKLASDAGFKNISADMMFGLPGQNVTGWLKELEELTTCELNHISCYQLTPEPGTPLGRQVAKGSIELPEAGAEFFNKTERFLKKREFGHYEISNYAKPGYESVHNTGYWEYRDYIGVGAGAHSAMEGERWANVKSIAPYIAKVRRCGRAVYKSEKLTSEMIQTEQLMMGLRLKKGIPFDGIAMTEGITKMLSTGMLKKTRTRLLATAKGWRVLDSVLAEL
ncbi:Hypothetical radical SAM family enzyme in heat shock gene cluster, similarity with CPO of BS HemN-type [hydrothermal vent metagenome]|uniref:Hypothetical radical SAM family enzyme in heat shock gene cluster, similarity with CPO of BS HemN-type n=1 Tax=hydrothermal vent metagenome TaxID=652676 RepID=A0A3B1BVR3_9ZZZZ